jgi:hypothetical protein
MILFRAVTLATANMGQDLLDLIHEKQELCRAKQQGLQDIKEAQTSRRLLADLNTIHSRLPQLR